MTPSATTPGVERAILRRRLRNLARTTHHAHRRLVGRTALTFRPRGRTSTEFPAHLLPLGELEAVSLAFRWHTRNGRVVPAATFAVYRLDPDPAAPGGVRLLPRDALDLCRGRGAGALDAARRPRDARDALALAQALLDADPPETGRPPRWPGVLDAADAGGPAGRGVHPPLADLTGLRGRNVRGPAFDVLVDHGVLERGQSYRAFLGSVTRRVGGRRVVADPRDDRTPAGRFRAALTAYATADPDREARLFDDLAFACRLAGVPLPEGDDRLDALAGLIDNPWDLVRLPRAAAVQVVATDDLLGHRDGTPVVPAQADRHGGGTRRRRPVATRVASPEFVVGAGG